MGVAGTGGAEDERTLDGLLAAVTFRDDGFGQFTAEARAITICTDPFSRFVRPASARHDPSLTASQRRELAECHLRTASVVPDAR